MLDRKQKKKLILLIGVLVIIDQILKIVFLTTKEKIGNTQGLSIGILDQMKSENNIQFILLYAVTIMLLIRYIARNNMFIKMNSRIIISFSIAGCISNLIDRIWSSGTINYINIPNFISLNLGYVYILVTWIGMAVILTRFTVERIKEKATK